MVKKRQRIAKKPTTPTPDDWITQGGIDPEIQKTAATSASEQVSTESSTDDKGKAYPHRISFDMETPQYKRLKFAAFDSEQTMNAILREAVEEWMKTRGY